MIDFDVSEIRNFTKLSAPAADFDARYTFYYDETNNIKKFYVRENDFNVTFTANFVLGGLVHEGRAPDVQPLISRFRLQKTVKEVKFSHIAHGDFLDCLKSEKLKLFLNYLADTNLYVHYSSLNILYWSIVDIVDSAILNSEMARQLDPRFGNQLKNDLYKLCRLEIDAVINLFYCFDYPNIKPDRVIPFIEALSSLFDGYLDTVEFHFGLESLRQILKEAKKKETLPFIMDEEDHILLKDLSQFYLRPIYTFKNATHILDNEDSIAEIFTEYRLLDNNEEINNYSFVDSQDNQLVQLSDVFVGLMGKFTHYLNTSTGEKIMDDFTDLNPTQSENIHLLMDIIDRSHDKNLGFIHSTDTYEELRKWGIVREALFI